MLRNKFLPLVLLLLLLLAACQPETAVEQLEEEEVAAEADAVEAEAVEEDAVDLVGLEDASEETSAAAEQVIDAAESAAVEPPPVPQSANSDLAGVTELSDELLALLPAFDEADIQTTESGLQYVILQEGEGDLAAPGDNIVAHYTGYLVNGEKFDSSVDRGVTFDFPLGQQRVIGGWDEGFALLTPGAKALLIIPPVLGYGPVGSPPTIPGDATLVFEVELVDIAYARKPIPVEDADYTVTDSGLKYFDFTVGDGATPADGDVVSVNFAVWDSVTGQLFGSSDDSGQPISFAIGREQMFDAMEEAVGTMQVGGSRQIIIGGELLAESGLPPGNDVIFELELMDVSEGAPQFAQELDESAFTELESGIRYAVITEGDGGELVEGVVAMVHYTVWLADGTQLDSSINRRSPESFPVGQSPAPGWNEGLAGAKVGEVRQIVVPADVVGDVGLGEPQDLTFEIEVLEIVGQ